MSSPMIRPARLEDCAAMSAIYNHYVLHDTCTYQTEPESLADRERWFQAHGAQHPVLVVEEGGRVIGWASLSPYNPRGGYRHTVEDSVYLDPACRGRGLGRALLERLIALGVASGHRTIIAAISAEQEASVRLHERLDFAVTGRLAGVGWKLGRWLDVVYLQRALDAPAPPPPVSPAPGAEIVRLDAARAAAALADLSALLVDAVEDGASVGFRLPLSREEAARYWQGVIDDVARGAVVLLGALEGGALVGTVQLRPSPWPSARHRAEVLKLLVLRRSRRRGIARQLMAAVDAEAHAAGCRLLLLDTRSGSAAEGLYRSMGYKVVGTIPDHSRAAAGGEMEPTTVLWRRLSP